MHSRRDVGTQLTRTPDTKTEARTQPATPVDEGAMTGPSADSCSRDDGPPNSGPTGQNQTGLATRHLNIHHSQPKKQLNPHSSDTLCGPGLSPGPQHSFLHISSGHWLTGACMTATLDHTRKDWTAQQPAASQQLSCNPSNRCRN